MIEANLGGSAAMLEGYFKIDSLLWWITRREARPAPKS
jgi:hypothetical protein